LILAASRAAVPEARGGSGEEQAPRVDHAPSLVTCVVPRSERERREPAAEPVPAPSTLGRCTETPASLLMLETAWITEC
jgi:hypothetical protein